MALVAYQPMDATIVVANVGSTLNFTATIQLLGPNGKALTHVGVVDFYFSTQDDGSDLAADNTDLTEIAILTDGLILFESVTDIAGKLISEADGAIDLRVTIIDTKTVYLVLVMPDGSLVISDAMSYTL